MASLFVIEGADQGKRFALSSPAMAMGRDSSNPIRLLDNEISRRHAELRAFGEGAYRIVDLGSANGTFVNGHPIDQAPLSSGDQIRLGRTVLLYNEGTAAARDLTARVDLLAKASPEDRSAIIRSLPAGEGSRLLEAPGNVGEWLRVRLANLGVLYQATQAISHIGDTDELLPRILQLVFDSINADRAAILLSQPGAEGLVPKVVRWRGDLEPDERMAISETIVEHVHQTGQGVISTDAPADERFGLAQSIVDFGIREAICVPVQGRHSTLGVLYADLRTGNEFVLDATGRPVPKGKFTNEHLMLMGAIGHQAGLAIENTRFYEAKMQAERLAAVGETIATLSHHIKNILQGLRSGSDLIDMGLKGENNDIVRKGWAIVEKNQTRIFNMVMDMLSFSKDREPSFEPADLNETVSDVVELVQSRARDLNVTLETQLANDLPTVQIDPEGIHRAVLNLAGNAIDAAEDAHRDGGGQVRIATGWDAESAAATIIVEDNGAGVPAEEIPNIFQVFTSSKGTRGTGLGLPVSKKIVQEHGGTIEVASTVGQGTTFRIVLPQRRADATGDDSVIYPVPPG